MFLYLAIFVLTFLYVTIKRHYNQWQRHGIPAAESVIPFGSLGALFRKEKTMGLAITDIYERFSDKIVGIMLAFKPAILVRDAELARQMLTKDFDSFHDRGVYVDEKKDPLSANLFSLKGQSWHNMRTKLSPSFSSGKLKAMFETVDEVGNKMIEHILQQFEGGRQKVSLDIKDITTTYAIDIIGSVIFGLDINSFKNPNNEFRLISDRIFKTNNTHVIHRIRNVMNFMCPPIARFLALFGTLDPITADLREIVKRTIEYREKHGVVRKDLLQLLLQLRNSGQISEDDNAATWRVETVAENLKSLSIDTITGNLLLFYIAGSETTSSTIAYTLYELAMYPEILQRAQAEVLDCLAKHNLKPSDHLTYDILQDLHYMDLCINETARKYPGLPVWNRECTKDYRLADNDFVIKKGTAIIIPIMGIGRDEKYFPQPMDYKPERYSEEKEENNLVAFMPFGDGPRYCIAKRMGVINVKAALVKILANFNIEIQPRKEVEFKFHSTPVLMPKETLKITLTKRC
ncbi:cytochrome P450 6d3-like [Musca domestica]|uniref:Cytochrome P450 6d3-like n=1 Tax=Musca domestica TaxID=7370 RepID=A0A9J7I4D5_MUSDO|nr:cytochrome P450 6d3-like [Musca domestica]